MSDNDDDDWDDDGEWEDVGYDPADDECWWCEGYWDSWATDCPTHSDSRSLSAADKRRLLGYDQ
jgi:hypothetical protein